MIKPGYISLFKNGFFVLASGKRLHNELERSTMFHGKTHYFYDHYQ
jgi:hypothetical protein